MKWEFSKIAQRLIKTVLIFGCAGLVVYAGLAARRPGMKAKKFCSSASIGMATKGLIERARESGGDLDMTEWSKSGNSSGMLLVVFPGIIPPTRHVCNITAAQGKVIKAEYYFVD